MQSSCYINEELLKRKNNDDAFAGATHALSAASVYLVIVSFFSSYMYKVLGTNNLWMLIASLCTVLGFALVNDLDNSASTSKSSLGLLGDALSIIFRGSSAVIQTTIRTKYDDDSPNPHRGFWHTTVACLLMGLLVFLGTNIKVSAFTLPIVGETTYGELIALIVTWLSVHLALAGMAKSIVKKIKKSAGIFGELAAALLSLGLTFALFSQIPKDANFWWLGVSVAVGMFIHTFFDAFTKFGTPLLWPLPIRGKMWYYIRFMKITSGGVFEKYIFVPFFLIVSVVSLIHLILTFPV